MNARVGNKPIHFVLGTNGENTINQKGRKLVDFSIEFINSHGVLEIAGQ
jgi:hypothetical protein